MKTVTFRDTFDAMPEADREKVLEMLREALMYRSHSGLGGMCWRDALAEIAEIFLRNGCEIMEYT